MSRVAIALSGGVDSSVAAALVRDSGRDAFAVTMRLLPGSSEGRCCGSEDTDVARAAAARLGLPFFVLDFEDDFRRHVLEDFAGAYRAGRTPLPCARCNSDLKFDRLLRRLAGLDAEVLATGHYARLGRDASGRRSLLRARDRDKDQSYFLFGLRPEILDRIEFPIGELTKPEVRALARRHGLPNAEKPESQDLCFAPAGGSRRAVEAIDPGGERGGDIVDRGGTRLGRHDGVSGFTIGQRRGLDLGGGEARYVVALEPETRRVVVGGRDEVASTALGTGPLNWLAGARPAAPLDVEVQVRYRQPPVRARLEPDAGGASRVVFAAPLVAAPGQAAVFYDGDRLLGGAWIETLERGAAANVSGSDRECGSSACG